MAGRRRSEQPCPPPRRPNGPATRAAGRPEPRPSAPHRPGGRTTALRGTLDGGLPVGPAASSLGRGAGDGTARSEWGTRPQAHAQQGHQRLWGRHSLRARCHFPPQQARGPGSLMPPSADADTQCRQLPSPALTLPPDPCPASRQTRVLQTAGPAGAPRPGVPGCKGSGRLASPVRPDTPTREADGAPRGTGGLPGSRGLSPTSRVGARLRGARRPGGYEARGTPTPQGRLTSSARGPPCRPWRASPWRQSSWHVGSLTSWFRKRVKTAVAPAASPASGPQPGDPTEAPPASAPLGGGQARGVPRSPRAARRAPGPSAAQVEGLPATSVPRPELSASPAGRGPHPPAAPLGVAGSPPVRRIVPGDVAGTVAAGRGAPVEDSGVGPEPGSGPPQGTLWAQAGVPTCPWGLTDSSVRPGQDTPPPTCQPAPRGHGEAKQLPCRDDGTQCLLQVLGWTRKFQNRHGPRL